MKFLRYFTIILFAFTSICLNAEQLPKIKKYYEGNEPKRELKQVIPQFTSDYKYTNKFLSVDFNIVDTLANPYSYFFYINQPFVYSPSLNKLITIKRGVDSLESMGNDNKNNLFLRVSDDLGKTWQNKVQVYNKKETNYQAARYPSCYGFEMGGELKVIFTGSLVNEAASQWYGYVNGVYSKDWGAVAGYEDSVFTDNGNIYQFETGSHLIGGPKNGSADEFYLLGVSALTSLAQDSNLNNAISYRRTFDLDKYEEVIPVQWASSKFKPTQSGYISRNVLGVKNDELGNLNVGVYGLFTDAPNFRSVGFSSSTDNGTSWTEFNICPKTVLDNFVTNLNIPFVTPDSAVTTWGAKDFVVRKGGCSFILSLYVKKQVGFTDGPGTINYIVEVYYENNHWGVRKVAEVTGYNWS